jgi:hypothetical protein
MKPEQALQIIQTVLDAAVKGGIIPNLAAAESVAQAWVILKNKLINTSDEVK